MSARKGLLHRFMLKPGPEEQEQVAAFFAEMQLPVPQRKEWRRTMDGGRLLFLSQYGCVIRISHKDAWCNSGNNPHYLGPLQRREVGSYMIDLYPGVRTPVSMTDRARIKKLFHDKHNLHIRDAHVNNFGFLPGTRFPVLLDLDAANVINLDADNVDKLKRRLQILPKLVDTKNLAQVPDYQDNYYDELKVMLRDAWQDRASANPDVISRFWQRCRHWRQEGYLQSCWINALPRRDQAYSKRVEAYLPA